jgi:hypothetical protein
MEEIHNDNPQVEGENKKQDCGCTDGSCQPKKKNIFSKLIFAAIILAALAIIGIKLAGHSGLASDKQTAAPGKAACCDSAKTNSKTCDTTRGSSCCSKK